MITTSPLPSKTGDTGDTGDTTVQEPGIRAFYDPPSVPGFPADRGQKWVRLLAGARS